MYFSGSFDRIPQKRSARGNGDALIEILQITPARKSFAGSALESRSVNAAARK